MTVSQVQQTTPASSMRMKRSDWLNSRNKERELWIAQHPKIGELTLKGAVKLGRDWFITWVCSCGAEGKSRWSDLKERVDNPLASCRSCVMRRRMADNPTSTDQLRRMSELAKQVNSKDPRFIQLRKLCNSAKKRCTNPKSASYSDYGGRGIQFKFNSPLQMAEWIVENLGYRPTKAHSIDRIDNNRHYERGNLRWATRKEQNSNKRAYKVGTTGERIQRLLKQTSYGYESIRTFIKQGLTDSEIISKRKTNSGRKPTQNPTSLRPCKRR